MCVYVCVYVCVCMYVYRYMCVGFDVKGISSNLQTCFGTHKGTHSLHVLFQHAGEQGIPQI
jgi:hypothetical protein